MNTFGKILVVLNLLAAVAVAAIGAYVFATFPNWKEYTDSLKRDVTVADASRATDIETKKRLEKDVEAAIAARNSAVKDAQKSVDDLKAAIVAEKLKTMDIDILYKEAKLNNDIIVQERERLRQENLALAKTLEISEKAKLAVQEKANEYHKDMERYRGENDTMQARLKNLLDQLRAKEQQLIALSTKGGGPGGAGPKIVRNPNDSNPPLTKVKGTVEKVIRDKDGRVFVQLSLGVDHDVKENNTLDVVRAQPRVEYLGTVRIVQSYAQKSVGILINHPTNSLIREGDGVVNDVAAP